MLSLSLKPHDCIFFAPYWPKMAYYSLKIMQWFSNCGVMVGGPDGVAQTAGKNESQRRVIRALEMVSGDIKTAATLVQPGGIKVHLPLFNLDIFLSNLFQLVLEVLSVCLQAPALLQEGLLLSGHPIQLQLVFKAALLRLRQQKLHIRVLQKEKADVKLDMSGFHLVNSRH